MKNLKYPDESGFKYFMSLQELWDNHIHIFVKSDELREIFTNLFENNYFVILKKGKIYYKEKKDE